MSDDAVNLDQNLSTFTERWSPRIVSQFNDCDVMVVKAEGNFNWHHQEDTDDFFFVLKGTLRIELRDRDVALQAGELFVVPEEVEHRPIAENEVHLLLIEPKGIPNTGDTATAAKKVSI